MKKLDNLFYARSVAVIGASSKPQKASYQIIKTMIHEGDRGTIFPINPSNKQVLGLKCYSSLLEVKKNIELLVVSVPAAFTYKIFKKASGRQDIQKAVILSAGFAEIFEPESRPSV